MGLGIDTIILILFSYFCGKVILLACRLMGFEGCYWDANYNIQNYYREGTEPTLATQDESFKSGMIWADVGNEL